MSYRTLSLSLAALASGTILAPQAGATPPTLPSICTGNHAVAESELTINDTHDIVEWTVAARPECVGATVTLAAHRTAFDRWEPSESQPLIGSNSMVLTAEAQTFRLRVSCGSQVDAVVGPALDVVDATHRYNELAIGGSVNRLVEAVYTGVDCAPEPTTTTSEAPPEATTTTQFVPQVTTVPTAPSTLVEVPTPLPEPTTSTTAEATTTTDQLVELSTAEALPFTGDHTGLLAVAGGATLMLGFGLIAKARRLEG